jgi:hypothetical protein
VTPDPLSRTTAKTTSKNDEWRLSGQVLLCGYGVIGAREFTEYLKVLFLEFIESGIISASL